MPAFLKELPEIINGIFNVLDLLIFRLMRYWAWLGLVRTHLSAATCARRLVIFRMFAFHLATPGRPNLAITSTTCPITTGPRPGGKPIARSPIRAIGFVRQSLAGGCSGACF